MQGCLEISSKHSVTRKAFDFPLIKHELIAEKLTDMGVDFIEAIQSFVNGIRQDLAAVKKAIELDYNNGLAEGSVNKIKVIKRIMYGRNSFQLLKGKVLRLELKRRIN